MCAGERARLHSGTISTRSRADGCRQTRRLEPRQMRRFEPCLRDDSASRKVAARDDAVLRAAGEADLDRVVAVAQPLQLRRQRSAGRALDDVRERELERLPPLLLRPQTRVARASRAVHMRQEDGPLQARRQLQLQDERHAVARERIGGRLHRTPMLGSRTLSERLGVPAHFKAELFQRTGAFKPRGVLNKLATLTQEEKERGVISISAGNHAQALAYASALEGIDALVVMWQTASQMKIAAARGYGATVDDSPPDIPAAFEWLDQLTAESGRVLIHPYDDPMVMAGQGTVGLEILEDSAEPPDVVLVQVGGGGLISGIATAVKAISPDTRVIAVEPELSRAMHESLKAGEPVTVEAKSAADGLNGVFSGPNCVRVCLELGVESVLVTEE